MLAAHDLASVFRSYSPGTNLQVVRREGSWVLVSDPITTEQGWVLDEYLSSIGSAGFTQVALESTTEPHQPKPPQNQKSGVSPLSAQDLRFGHPIGVDRGTLQDGTGGIFGADVFTGGGPDVLTGGVGSSHF